MVIHARPPDGYRARYWAMYVDGESLGDASPVPTLQGGLAAVGVRADPVASIEGVEIWGFLAPFDFERAILKQLPGDLPLFADNLHLAVGMRNPPRGFVVGMVVPIPCNGTSKTSCHHSLGLRLWREQFDPCLQIARPFCLC